MSVLFDLEERKRLWNCGEISKNFPLKFDNGAQWTSIEGKCNRCNKPIPKEDSMGEVTQTFRNIYHVKMVCFCRACSLVTYFDWNVKPDGLTGKDDGGNWRQWSARPVGRFRQFWNKIFKK
jgi:hypothetical protein